MISVAALIPHEKKLSLCESASINIDNKCVKIVTTKNY